MALFLLSFLRLFCFEAGFRLLGFSFREFRRRKHGIKNVGIIVGAVRLCHFITHSFCFFSQNDTHVTSFVVCLGLSGEVRSDLLRIYYFGLSLVWFCSLCFAGALSTVSLHFAFAGVSRVLFTA
jgi:hypothetical protein